MKYFVSHKKTTRIHICTNCRILQWVRTMFISDPSRKKGPCWIDWWCWRRFQQYFSYIPAASAPVHAFLEFFLPVLSTIFSPSHWLLSHITIVQTMDSSEREMTPVTMTNIKPQKGYWPSWGLNQRPPVLRSAPLLIELWGSADHFGFPK